ncbi:Two component regulator propeller [compost metagenome]
MNECEFQGYDPRQDVCTDVPGVGSIISYIYEDRSGKLWIGTRSGLKCMNRKTREILDISELVRGYSGELLYINWMMEDQHGRMWIGTQSSGLFLIRKGKLHWFGQGKGLSGNTVNAILEDKNH